MADDVVIRAEGLGKKYVIGHQAERERYVALRDVLARTAQSGWRKMLDMWRGRPVVSGDTTEEFWALKDVGFEVKRGEVVGIIGRNGAGKTTLLKILSRITEPTEGQVTIEGRVASLLEVGTGFHPELTGRENIYLNGAILGMTRAEIRLRFDEIVAFAEVEQFLDTPVKRYSSGMYVRLAFAVAAHLEPEILIVDEVLAVGDIEFQKKCLGKMSEVASGGRTVLFVSHNLGSVATLCQTGLLIDSGHIVVSGSIQSVIGSYIKSKKTASSVVFPPQLDKPSITRISINEFALDKGEFNASIEFTSPFPLHPPIGGFIISSATGIPVWGTNGRFHQNDSKATASMRGTLLCHSLSVPLVPSTYIISAWLGDWRQDFDAKLNALTFDFKSGFDNSRRPSASAIGYTEWSALWSLEAIDASSAPDESACKISQSIEN
jgi:lipopolysaccharide transport system ATP-binding protein